MKKAISLGIFILLLILVYQWSVLFFKSEHQIDYIFKEGETEFQVKEEFQKNIYYLTLTKDSHHFLLEVPNQFGKSKEILKDLLTVEKDNTLCIYPIYPNKVTDTIWCSNSSTMTSYEREKENPIVKELETKVKELGYTLPEEKELKEMVITGQTTYYYKDKSDYTVLWDYTGFYVLNGEFRYKTTTNSFDRYENTLSTLVDSYYVSPIYNDNKLYETYAFKIQDVTTGAEEEIVLPEALSNDTYINGTIGQKLYLFDKKNIKQYVLDVKNKTVRQIGSKEENAQYYNGKFETRNIYDFVNSKITFTTEMKEKVKQLYSCTQVAETKDRVYFVSQNKLYQVYKKDITLPILILEKEGIKELQASRDRVYFISNDTFYRYSKTDGLEKVITSTELRYNSKNIIFAYAK